MIDKKFEERNFKFGVERSDLFLDNSNINSISLCIYKGPSIARCKVREGEIVFVDHAEYNFPLL